MRNLNLFFVILLSSLLFATSVIFAPAKAASPLDDAMQATFVIRSDDLEESLLGSGFLFYGPGILVTNAHVVGSAGRVLVIAKDGSRQVAAVIGRDELRDIAILRIVTDRNYLQPSSLPYLGQPVFALGAPFGIEFSLSRGVVSALERQIEQNVPLKMLQHDAAVNPGSSGGPLIDADGRLLGMNSQIADGFRHYIGISYAIPTIVLTKVVADLLAGSHHENPQLGLRVRPVTAKIARALDLPDRQGVLVDHVAIGGVGAASGIKSGDILLSLGGRAIHSTGDLAFALASSVSLEQAAFDILRDGKVHTIKLVLGHQSQTDLAQQSRGLPSRVRVYSFAQVGLTILPDGRIEAVELGSLGQFLGLGAGDQVLALNGQTGFDPASFQIIKPTLMLIRLSDGTTRHFMLDPWAKPGRLMPVGGANILDRAVVLF